MGEVVPPDAGEQKPATRKEVREQYGVQRNCWIRRGSFASALSTSLAELFAPEAVWGPENSKAVAEFVRKRPRERQGIQEHEQVVQGLQGYRPQLLTFSGFHHARRGRVLVEPH